MTAGFQAASKFVYKNNVAKMVDEALTAVAKGADSDPFACCQSEADTLAPYADPSE